MKALYERFGLTTDAESEVEKFRTKIYNLLDSSKFGSEVLDDKEDDIVWRLANRLGERYDQPTYTVQKMRFIFPSDLLFNEFLFRLQVVLDLLWGSRREVSVQLSYFIANFFNESTLNLGYFVKIYKTKSPQILPASNKRLERKLISAIDQLEAKSDRYSIVIEHFEAGIRELLTARTKAQLKDVVEDMATVCDSLIKVVFKDENLGFKHIFKDGRWQKAKLNTAQKKIFSDLNNTMDQIKHDVLKSYAKDDVEIIVYLVSAFIERLAK